MLLYHLLKGKHIDSDRSDFLAKFLQHIYGKTVKMHFVELLTDDVGWTFYFPKLFLLRREWHPNFKTLVRYLGTQSVVINFFYLLLIMFKKVTFWQSGMGPSDIIIGKTFPQTNAKKPCSKLKSILSKRKHFLP